MGSPAAADVWDDEEEDAFAANALENVDEEVIGGGTMNWRGGTEVGGSGTEMDCEEIGGFGIVSGVWQST